MWRSKIPFVYSGILIIKTIKVMEFTKKQIADFWNQAILNETGFEGNIIPQIFSYEDIEVTYKSKNDETVIKLLGTNLAMDFENETVVLGSKNGLNNFQYYY